MSGAFLLVTVATILFDMVGGGNSNDDDQNVASQGIAFGLLSFGAIICGYAVFVYYRRLRLLESRQSFGYHDRHAPVLLATALLVGIAMLLWYFSDAFTTSVSLSGTGPRPVLRSDGQMCTQQDLRGVQLLQYQPSDVLPLADRPGVLLVPSLSQITSVSVVEKSTDSTSTFANVQVVADVAGTDIEAITHVGDRIFAVSEDGNKKSLLMEFRWKSNNNNNNSTAPSTLELVSSVKIASPLVEGLAYVDGDLYVAGNRFDERTGLTVGSIDIYPNFVDTWSDWHDTDNNTVRKGPNHTSTTTGDDDDTTLSGHRLNSKLLDHGLVDSKIGALYYHEDILYILYDNAQLVRGWRLQSSEQVLEWPLPAVPGPTAAVTTTTGGWTTGDYDKQWEGLAVERRHRRRADSYNNNNNSDSKNEDHGSLVLHLTLDSPPQIWSLQLVETKEGTAVAAAASGTVPYYPSLPECATRH